MTPNIDQLIAAMTLEEKAGLCSGADFWHTKAVERLGIPAIMMSDGPHGLRKQEAGMSGINESVPAVCFPAGCATAASFDTALLRREGEILGRECRAEGVNILLGPAINIKRSPLCGRNFEYYSEDPCLAGALAAAFVQGLQGQGVGACLKHFAANNQEYCRMTASSNLDERTLREIYLPAFEAAVRTAQPWAVMCSYNRLNGVYAGENPLLLEKILRGEWGFDGIVMSDWGAVNDRVKGVAAGLELEMPGNGGINDAKLVAAVQNGQLEQAVLDKAVKRLLNIILRAADLANAAPAPVFDRLSDHAEAAEMARQCAVLLKNKGVLPLRSGQKIAYIGGFAKTPRYQGGGSSHINAGRVDSALDIAAAKRRNVQYVEGFPAEYDQREEAEFLRAVNAAAEADVAVVFAGLPESFESEGFDRRHMRLPDCQNNLIDRVAAVQKNTVVVLHTGSPVECPWAEDVAAVLCMYLGGEGVGDATDAVLFGETNPSGRLPETWPLRLEDTPAYLNFGGDGSNVDYAEGLYVGYRYYDARRMPVRWPFGHGLGYSGFVYRDAALGCDTLAEDGEVTVSLTVKNGGALAGQEVVQLYVAPPAAPGTPPQSLRRFEKIHLEPGEEKQLHFTLTARDLGSWDAAQQGWYAAPGVYKILVGHSSRDIHATLELKFTTTRRPPLKVDENTRVGTLLADERTAPVLRSVLAQLGSKELEGGLPWLEEAPLRALAAFGGAQAGAALPALLAALRAAAG